MRSSIMCVAAVTIISFALGASAQEAPAGGTSKALLEQATEPTAQAGYIYVPESSKERPEDKGSRFHTTYVVHSVDGNKPSGLKTPTAQAIVTPLGTIEEAETPQSLGCLYVASPSSPGCVPNYDAGSGGPSAGGYGAIALVDAYDNPDAATDLETFDSYWGLATANFTKVYANGNGSCKTPPANADWSVEESLDIEWAHVFAPSAAIVLVEACSSSINDLLYAEQVAFNYIVTNYPTTGGQVSNSWQGSEFTGQLGDDALFADFTYNFATGYKTAILAFASSGDGGYGVGYPSTNPWVVSAGGTSILRTASTLKFSSESCWGGSGGGPSAIETYVNSYTGGNTGSWADYQYPLVGQSNRATPDMSFDADPASGVYIFNKYNYGGWGVVGGTSVASPALASIVNRAGNRLGSVFLTPATSGSDYFANAENTLLYSQLATAKAYKSNFYDVKTGSNGSSAVASWDYCTGVGSPRGLLGK
jgi:kumamolisin